MRSVRNAEPDSTSECVGGVRAVKFCAKCGREIQEGAKFCPACGAPVQNVEPAAGFTQASKKASPRVMLAAAGIVAVIVLAVIGVKLFSGTGYQKPIENLEKGLNEQDMDLLAKVFVDGEFLSSEIFGVFESLGGLIEYNVELEIESEDKLDRDEIIEVLTEDYDVESVYAQKASAAYILEVEMTMSMGDYCEEETWDIPVAKIDGKWVIPLDVSEVL